MIKIITYVIGLILTSAILTEYFLYSQNTLVQNNQWIAGKRMIKMVSMGADEFLLERSALAKNRVDLGRYFGFQEIYTRKKFAPTKITFDFLIKKGSYLDAYIINETGMRKGIRLKPDNSESLFFKRDPLNRVIDQQVFNSSVSSNRWRRAELLFSNKTLSGQIGDVKFKISIDPIESGSFGLQSGMNGALVDNIEIKDKDGVAFTENFRRTTQWNTIFVNFLGRIFLLFETILGLIFLLYFLLRKAERPILRNFLIYQTLTCCVLLFLFDYQFWSGRQYFNQTKMIKDGTFVSTIFLERWRFDGMSYLAHHFLLNKDPHELLENLNYPFGRIYKGPIACGANHSGCKSYQNPEDALAQFEDKKNCTRVIFLGTSQTIGAGASDLQNTFFVKTHEKLKSRLQDRCIESLNIASSGGTLPDLYSDYIANYVSFSPDLMVMNLGNNDEVPTLLKHLPKLIHFNKENNVRNLYFAELNAPNDHFDYYMSAQQEVQKVVSEAGVPIVDKNKEFASIHNKDKAVLWWDYVHMSDAGQEIVSEWITEAILGPIKNKKTK